MSDPGRLVDTLLRESFTLSTLAGDPATGITWSIVWARDGAGNAWVPVISEQGDGLYELGSTPSVTGWHHAWITGIDGLGARRNVAFSERIVGTTSTIVLRPGDAVELLVLSTDASGNGIATDITVDTATNALGATFTPTVAAVDGETGAYLLTFTVPANDASLGPWSVALTVDTDQPYRLLESWDVMQSSAIDASSLLEADATGPYALGTFGAYVTNFYTALSAGSVTLVSPVDAVTGNATIEQGDDDTLSWTDAAWPDLTGATITLTARHEITKVTTTASGIVDVATGSDKRVSVALSHTVTAAMTPGAHAMQVTATISGVVSTLVSGTLTVVKAS